MKKKLETAEQEIERLKALCLVLEGETRVWQKRILEAKDHVAHKAYIRERDKLWQKHHNMQNAIEAAQKSGFSAAMLRAVQREMSAPLTKFVTTFSSSSPGSRTRTKVGYCTALKALIVVSVTEWNGFMRNVKGCASMAGRKDINSVVFATPEEVDALLRIGHIRKGFTGYVMHDVPSHTPITVRAADLVPAESGK